MSKQSLEKNAGYYAAPLSKRDLAATKNGMLPQSYFIFAIASDSDEYRLVVKNKSGQIEEYTLKLRDNQREPYELIDKNNYLQQLASLDVLLSGHTPHRIKPSEYGTLKIEEEPAGVTLGSEGGNADSLDALLAELHDKAPAVGIGPGPVLQEEREGNAFGYQANPVESPEEPEAAAVQSATSDNNCMAIYNDLKAWKEDNTLAFKETYQHLEIKDLTVNDTIHSITFGTTDDAPNLTFEENCIRLFDAKESEQTKYEAWAEEALKLVHAKFHTTCFTLYEPCDNWQEKAMLSVAQRLFGPEARLVYSEGLQKARDAGASPQNVPRP